MENLALTESTYYILLSLYHPQHGYGIMQQTEQLSGGRVRLAAGTLYGALNALCEKRLDFSPAHGKREPEKRISADPFRVRGTQARVGPAGRTGNQWPQHFTGGISVSETKKLHKVFWVWEYEKEERWLNEMAQEGWALKKASLCTYVFEKDRTGRIHHPGRNTGQLS